MFKFLVTAALALAGLLLAAIPPTAQDEGTARLLWAAVVVEDTHLAEDAETGTGVVQAEDGGDGRAGGVMHGHGDGVRGGLAGGSDEGFGPHMGILRQVVDELQA